MALTSGRLSQALLDALPDAFRIYPDDAPPLLAHGTCHVKRQRYLFTKKLRLWRSQRHELRYLFHVPVLDFNSMALCLDTAMEQASAQIKPGQEHRRWDISILILCDTAHPDALERLERFGPTARYKLGFHGRMCARAAAIQPDTGEVTHSRHGRTLARFAARVLQADAPEEA